MDITRGIYGLRFQADGQHGRGRGRDAGRIATANSNVTLRRTVVEHNSPDNCNPLSTIPGCVN